MCPSSISSAVGVSCTAVTGQCRHSLGAVIQARTSESVTYYGLGDSKRSRNSIGQQSKVISTGQGSLSSRAGKSTIYWAEYTRVNLRRWLCCMVEIALALEPSRPSVLLDFRKITSTLYASVSYSVKWLWTSHKIFYIMCLAHNRCSKNVNLPSLLYFIPGWKIVSISHSACLEKLVLARLGGQWSNMSGYGTDSSHSCTPVFRSSVLMMSALIWVSVMFSYIFLFPAFLWSLTSISAVTVTWANFFAVTYWLRE